VDAQQEMEPDDLGEAVTIPPSSRSGHLVVHLRDSGGCNYSISWGMGGGAGG
jgi:hypothetical protein